MKRPAGQVRQQPAHRHADGHADGQQCREDGRLDAETRHQHKNQEYIQENAEPRGCSARPASSLRDSRPFLGVIQHDAGPPGAR